MKWSKVVSWEDYIHEDLIVLCTTGLQREGGKKVVDSKKPNPEMREGKVLSDKLNKKGFKEEKQRLPRNVNSRKAKEHFFIAC